MQELATGEHVDICGSFRRSDKWGVQFHAQRVATTPPVTADAISKYLARNLPGIGPASANKIIAHFGTAAVFGILDRAPERLHEIQGLRRLRIDAIRKAWSDQVEKRNALVWLQQHGLGPTLAGRVWSIFKEETRSHVKAQPYSLIAAVPGIAFTTADEFAQSMGLKPDDPARLREGLQYAIETERVRNGHVGLPRHYLLESAVRLLGPYQDAIAGALSAAIENNELLAIAQDEHGTMVFPRMYHAMERGVARHLLRLRDAHPARARLSAEAVHAALEQAQAETRTELSTDQLAAAGAVLAERVVIVTGGPGVGKTTILKTVVQALQGQGEAITLCAPTGRAARRMEESIGLEAQTIHRALGWGKNGFYHNARQPLDATTVVVDEASMIDVGLMHAFVQAIASGARLVIVGDRDQLPSIGPGQVLADCIDSGHFEVARLHNIHRQAATSHIIVYAHRINQGLEIPSQPFNPERDFAFLPQDDPARVADLIVKMVAERIPDAFGIPSHHVQVITPMHRHVVGTSELNKRLQEAVNPAGEPVPLVPHRAFRVGDRVMQTKNNYELGVFNGDIGRIAGFDREKKILRVRFGKVPIDFEDGQAGTLALAYAITVHKSQGSEYPVIVAPVVTQHWILLQRKLLYTAVTRARQRVFLIGQRRALDHAIRHDAGTERFTHLRPLLDAHSQAARE